MFKPTQANARKMMVHNLIHDLDMNLEVKVLNIKMKIQF